MIRCFLMGPLGRDSVKKTSRPQGHCLEEGFGYNARGGNFNRQVTGGAILMCEVMP